MLGKLITLFFFAYSVTALSQDKVSQSALKQYEQGLAYQQLGDLNAAEISFKNSVQKNSDFLPARLALGEVLLDLGNIESAKKELLLALSMKADTESVILPLVRAHLLLNQYQNALDLLAKYANLAQLKNYALYQGNAHLALRQFEAANIAYQQELESFGGSVELFTSIAQLYLQQNQLVLSEQAIEKALTLDKNNIPALLLRTQVEKQQGNITKAIGTLDEILSNDSKNQQAIFGKAYLLVEQNELQQALDLVLSLRKNDVNNPFAKLLHASIIAQQGEGRQAKRLLSDIQQQLSGLSNKFRQQQQILLLSAAVDMNNQNYFEARRKYKQLINLYGEDFAALKSLATIEFRLKNYHSSEQYLVKALAMKDSDTELYLLFSQVLKLNDKADKVLPMLASAFDKFPNNRLLQAHYVSALVNQGKYQQALDISDKNNQQTSLANRTLLGYLLLQNKDYPQAMSHTQALLAEFGNKVEILQLAGELSVKTGHPAKGKEFFKQAIILAPEFQPPYFALAGLAMNEQNSADAENYYQQLLSLNESDDVARNLYADLAIKQGWYGKAIQLLSFNLSIENYAKSRALLSLYMKTGQFSLAEELLTPLLLEYRLDENLLLTKAKIAIEQGQLASASKTLSILFSMAYDDAKKLKVLAHVQIDAKDIDGVNITVARLSTLDSALVDDYLLTRQALLSKQFAQASVIVTRNLKSSENNVQWQELKAYVLLGSQDFDGAITLLKSMLDKDNNRQHMQLLAQVYSQQNNKIALTQLLSHWLQSAPSDAWAVVQLSQIHHANGDFEQAKQIIESYPFLDNNPAFLNNLANYYIDTDLNKALSLAEKAYTLAPASADINDTLGWVYAKRGDITKAVSLLREASIRDNNNGDILYHLAYSLLQMNSHSQAKLAFDKAVKLLPEHKLRSELAAKFSL
jgi:putative PEP-CTERM system TPR-repeat lipoprotein